ncbi:conjugal transfer protein MobC [Sphingobacterium corticis]|uniref:Conjugal transfer protein MobC n=1 Tax=Sphingobacterium corticis TaxID=1812823 RepID=A0ABW5NJB8_9SPHI
MALQTGENEQALRKILDMTRMLGIVILCLHFYYYGYSIFASWGLHSSITDSLMNNIQSTGLFTRFHYSKVICLGLVIVSLLGAKGRKSEKINYGQTLRFLIMGILLYFTSVFIFKIGLAGKTALVTYIILTSLGLLFIITSGTLLTRIIKQRLSGADIFNRENETFPQEERYLHNEYSINLPARYQLKKQHRNSWINIINPFRATLVLGSPGSGKSYFVIRHFITQHIAKGFSMFIYDFKFDDLSRIAYNTWLANKHQYSTIPKFYVINFDNLNRTHRCNPLEPSSMNDITDAAESARTILMGLNREWIKKQGDFFVESPINFLTAIIWYLRCYRDGEFCTLPHVIELMQSDYNSLFTLLRTEKEIEVLINPFVNAYLNGATDQLEGQIASAKIAMARLASPQLYYVLSGDDFRLDLNNPADPKIICMGNNPQKIQTYGAVLSLYVNRLIKIVNQKKKLKSSLIFDEFPTIYLNNIDSLMATARSNLVSTVLGVQDFSQLRKDYGREQADVIVNIAGNIISGQVTGDTAKQLSDRFGKILQDRESLSINSTDTSITRSKQLDLAIPASKISTLSSGEFVGIVADNPDTKIDHKIFNAEIVNDHNMLAAEQNSYQDIPDVRAVTQQVIQQNYLQIKQDIQLCINVEMDRLRQNPSLSHLVIEK